jgi:hypothetical protein
LHGLKKLRFDLGKCFIPNNAGALFCNFGGVNGCKPRWEIAKDSALAHWMCGREKSLGFHHFCGSGFWSNYMGSLDWWLEKLGGHKSKTNTRSFSFFYCGLVRTQKEEQEAQLYLAL